MLESMAQSPKHLLLLPIPLEELDMEPDMELDMELEESESLDTKLVMVLELLVFHLLELELLESQDMELDMESEDLEELPKLLLS